MLNTLKLSLEIKPGEYDDVLKWPVTITVTLELINHLKDGKNKGFILKFGRASSVQPVSDRGSQRHCHLGRGSHSSYSLPPDYEPLTHTMRKSELDYTSFVKDGLLHFVVTNIGISN